MHGLQPVPIHVTPQRCGLNAASRGRWQNISAYVAFAVLRPVSSGTASIVCRWGAQMKCGLILIRGRQEAMAGELGPVMLDSCPASFVARARGRDKPRPDYHVLWSRTGSMGHATHIKRSRASLGAGAMHACNLKSTPGHDHRHSAPNGEPPAGNKPQWLCELNPTPWRRPAPITHIRRTPPSCSAHPSTFFTTTLARHGTRRL